MKLVMVSLLCMRDPKNQPPAAPKIKFLTCEAKPAITETNAAPLYETRCLLIIFVLQEVDNECLLAAATIPVDPGDFLRLLL